MKAQPMRLPVWRRPPLLLIVFGLTITYAELAIESETLVEAGLAIEQAGGGRL